MTKAELEALINTYVKTNFTREITENVMNYVLRTLASSAENPENKNVANGYAGLDASGKVNAAQLPSYVDDILEYADFASLPTTGEAGKIYITLDDNKSYRWSGSAYAELVNTVPGASEIAVTDSGGFFDGANVETILAELGDINENRLVNTYTPTANDLTNIDEITTKESMYLRFGNFVIVFAHMVIGATAVGRVIFNLTLPISSSLSNRQDLIGVAVTRVNNGIVTAKTADNEMTVDYETNTTVLRYVNVISMYKIS